MPRSLDALEGHPGGASAGGASAPALTAGENRKTRGRGRLAAAMARLGLLNSAAAEVAFFLALSLVPFVGIAIVLVGRWLPAGMSASIGKVLRAVLPAESLVSGDVMRWARSSASRGWLTAGFLLACWSSFRFTARCTHALTSMMTGGVRPFAWTWRSISRSLLLLVVWMTALLATALFLLVAPSIQRSLLALPALSDLSSWTFMAIRALLVPSVLFGAIGLTYRVVAGSRVGASRVVLAALLATLGWTGASVGFSFAVPVLWSAARFYGTLGSLVLFLIWTYLIAWILLLGGLLLSSPGWTRRRGFMLAKAAGDRVSAPSVHAPVSSLDRLNENESNDWTESPATPMLPVEENEMKPLMRVLPSMAFLGFASLLLAQGSPVQRTTKLNVTEPTEISGTILQPGTYVIRVHDFTNGKVQVQVTDESDKKVFATVTAMRMRRNLDTNQQQADQTEFTYTTANGHPALATWFYPGDEWGEQFTSGKATWPAEAVAVAQTPEVVKAPEPAAAPAPAPVAAYNPPAPEPAATAPKPTAPAQLPTTASDLPLLALIGLGALGGAAALHLVRRTA